MFNGLSESTSTQNVVNLADSSDTFTSKFLLATYSIQIECRLHAMIANVKILPSLTKFNHSKIDVMALLQLLKQLVLVRLVFGPGGKLQ